LLFELSLRDFSCAQEQAAIPQQGDVAQLKFRKTIKTRDYQGKQVEGEERIVSPGDSLWKFLVQEKGIPEKQFPRYVTIIGTLNPHLKNPNVLEVGDTVFIPIRPGEIVGITIPARGKSEAKIYSVKPGDHLFKILREQLGIRGAGEIINTVRQVEGMNPGKKNWNILFVGEALMLPGRIQPKEFASQEVKKPSEKTIATDGSGKLPLQGNITLLEQIMTALGTETHRSGEETLPLQEGVIRIDRESYPVIQSAKAPQKVILDLKGQIPPDLKTKIEGENSTTRVVVAKPGASVQETVSGLLSRLGFQSLPPNRPVIIQDAGVGVVVKGEWMVTSPEASNENPEMLIISLVDPSTKTPDYLKDYLAVKGVSLKEILLPEFLSSGSPSADNKGVSLETQSEAWPSEKSALVDAFLKLYQIPFSTNRQISLPLQRGILIEFTVDRQFELGGKKIAFVFHRVGGEVKNALQTAEGVTPVDLDLPALSSRELISRLLESIGQQTAYEQHRFSANGGSAKDKLVFTISGFFLPKNSLLLTDGEIPKGLERFFTEKRLRVVRFH
jgi:hypothetical protein